MLIEAPCRLGEKFTHHRSYSNPKEQYLLGIDLSIWHCNIDGVTLLGGPYKKGTVDFFERKDMDALPISFEETVGQRSWAWNRGRSGNYEGFGYAGKPGGRSACLIWTVTPAWSERMCWTSSLPQFCQRCR